ncbi:MAG TPA: hypothetical protein VGE37_07190, partial [Archangium sp.]
MNKVLAASFGVLVLGVTLGLLVRFGQLAPLGIPAENATHAHSHALYWGWAGLALFALFFERVGLTGRLSQLVLGTIGFRPFGAHVWLDVWHFAAWDPRGAWYAANG